MSLHFDGMRVDQDCFHAAGNFIRDAEEYISQNSGYYVKLVQKKHDTFIDMMKNGQYKKNQAQIPKVLSATGNCIPLAIWRVLGRPHPSSANSTKSTQ